MKLTDIQKTYLEHSIYTFVREIHSKYQNRFFVDWWAYYENLVEKFNRSFELMDIIYHGNKVVPVKAFMLIPRGRLGQFLGSHYRLIHFVTEDENNPIDIELARMFLQDIATPINEDEDRLNNYRELRNGFQCMKKNLQFTVISFPLFHLFNGTFAVVKRPFISKTTLTIPTSMLVYGLDGIIEHLENGGELKPY